VFGFSGTYSFDDVLARASFDGGVSWGFAPVKVNSPYMPYLSVGSISGIIHIIARIPHAAGAVVVVAVLIAIWR
jgi:hypothetical protein